MIQTNTHWCLFCQYLFGIYSVKVISTEKWCLEWRNHKVWKTNYHLFDITWSSWLGGGVWGGVGVVGGLGGRYTWGFWRSECKWVKIPQRKRSQILLLIFYFWVSSKFFFPTWKVVPGAYSDQRETPGDTWNTPKKWFFWPKEAERGWKSGARPLSWKSRWKPSIRREFWHQRI